MVKCNPRTIYMLYMYSIIVYAPRANQTNTTHLSHQIVTTHRNAQQASVNIVEFAAEVGTLLHSTRSLQPQRFSMHSLVCT